MLTLHVVVILLVMVNVHLSLGFSPLRLMITPSRTRFARRCLDTQGALLESVSSPEIDKLSAKINELKASIAVVKSDIDAEQKTLKQLDDEYGAEIARVRKEFSRMKERSYEESTTISNKAKVDAVKEILPLGDNYQRARKVFQPLNSVEESQIAEEYDRLFESFNKVLEEFGVTKVSSLGEPFDVNFMEAIMTAPSTEYPQDVVCTEYQVGYRMGDMCVRPAMVVVSLGPGPPS